MSEKRKPGRPLIGDERAEYLVGFKACRALKQKLVAAANLGERSLSEECRARLERSFRDDDLEALVKRWMGEEPTMAMDDGSISPRSICEKTGISRGTLNSWAHTGIFDQLGIPRTTPGKARSFSGRDLMALAVFQFLGSHGAGSERINWTIQALDVWAAGGTSMTIELPRGRLIGGRLLIEFA